MSILGFGQQKIMLFVFAFCLLFCFNLNWTGRWIGCKVDLSIVFVLFLLFSPEISIMWFLFNTKSTTSFLTPFLIGSYHEIFIHSANYDKALKLLHQKLAHDFFFNTLSDWFNKW